MKYALLSLFFVLGACTSSTNQNQIDPKTGAAPQHMGIEGEMTVMGERSVIEATMNQMGLQATIETFDKDLNLHAVNFSGASYTEVQAKLGSKVELMEQNSRVQLDAVEKKVEWLDDQYFFYQWSMNNIGQSAPWGLPGKYDADVKILQALKEFGGQIKEDTVVAVIDTGVDYSHDDLNANMWVNKAESTKEGGVAGQDEDGNGYFDDVHGFDFTSGGRTAPYYGKAGDPDPVDDHGHGSHVSGVIAAVHNNQKGIAGINPRAKIMALRALTGMGGTKRDIDRAIAYAIDKKVDVINGSYGGKGKSEITKKLLEKAGEAGILFVAAAGNDGANQEIENNRHYPSGYQLPNLISVASSDNMDNPAVSSNYGHNYTDVFAPGVGILSLYKDGGYTIMGGTSMASPLVAGLASLIMSVYPELKGNPARVKEIIMATVDTKASMYGKVASNGRVNALKALQQAATAVKTSPLVWQEEAQSVSQMGHNEQLVDIKHKISKPGAQAMKVHFDFVEIDRQFDSIYIYDKNWKLVTELQNGSARDLWSPVVTGDTVYVRFVNAKVKKNEGAAPVKMANNKMNDCLKAGGYNAGPVVSDDPTKAITSFLCVKDDMSYRYEDLQKDVEDTDVFFSWQSEGFSIDKIQFTESAI